MPYVSHPVRHVRDDPVEGEPIDLVVRLADDADPDDVTAALRDLGGEGVEDRGLGALVVTVPQQAVADVCNLEGLASVETTNTLAFDLDGAGEDVEF
jgi:hypothetical protein